MDNSCAKLPVFHIPSKQNWMPDSKELSDRRSNGGHSKWAVRDMDLGSNTGFIYTCAAVRFDADSWQPGVYHVFWPSWAESGPGPNHVEWILFKNTLQSIFCKDPNIDQVIQKVRVLSSSSAPCLTPSGRQKIRSEGINSIRTHF